MLFHLFSGDLLGVIRGDQVKMNPELVLVGLPIQLFGQFSKFLADPVFEGRKFPQEIDDISLGIGRTFAQNLCQNTTPFTVSSYI